MIFLKVMSSTNRLVILHVFRAEQPIVTKYYIMYNGVYT